MDFNRRFFSDLCILVGIFAANLIVIAPFLSTEYSNQPWNNSYIYMAISKMFRDLQWTWNPLQYAGAPFHYLYPPLFHLSVIALPFVSIGRAFHLVTGCGYAFAPVCIYLLASQLFRSRSLAAFAAIAYSIFPSPIYSVLSTWKGLAHPYANAPWGFVAVVGYEEAAHAFAFPFTLLSIAAAWRQRWVWSSFLAAIVILINWPAMIGLAVIFVALAMAQSRDRGVPAASLRTIGILGTAYGLSAFWITPGYVVSSRLLNGIVLAHTNAIQPWNGTTAFVLIASAVLIGLSFWKRIPAVGSFLLTWIAVAGAVVASFTLAGNWLVPMPNRYMMELNAASVLFVTWVLSLAPLRTRRGIVALATICGLLVSFNFLSKAWSVQPPRLNPATLISYQIANWFTRNAPHARVLVSGELDGTLALWSGTEQVGGTGQDISNFLIFAAQRQVQFGCDADAARVAEEWLRAMNVTYLVVHEAQSKETYHWFSTPSKFASWPVAWKNDSGDVIYRIPGGQDAVVVDLAALRRLPPLRSTADEEFLAAYVEWAKGKRPVTLRWEASDRAALDATLGPDEGVLIKSNFDAGWRSSQGNLAADPIGFLLLKNASGKQTITLEFGATWEVWLGRAISLAALLALVFRVPVPWIGPFCLIPAMAAYAVLTAKTSPNARIAEEAFTRLQPALISPNGVVDSVTNAGPPFARGHKLLIYGTSLGAGKHVSVRIGQRSADISYRNPNVIVFQLPEDTPSKFDLSVEVDGCRGNEFEFDAR